MDRIGAVCAGDKLITYKSSRFQSLKCPDDQLSSDKRIKRDIRKEESIVGRPVACLGTVFVQEKNRIIALEV
jgi:hypothetical protein